MEVSLIFNSNKTETDFISHNKSAIEAAGTRGQQELPKGTATSTYRADGSEFIRSILWQAHKEIFIRDVGLTLAAGATLTALAIFGGPAALTLAATALTGFYAAKTINSALYAIKYLVHMGNDHPAETADAQEKAIKAEPKLPRSVWNAAQRTADRFVANPAKFPVIVGPAPQVA
jgi:hypothetical protein